LIKDLVQKGAVRSQSKGSRLYEVVLPFQPRKDMLPQLLRILPLLTQQGHVRNQDLQSALGFTRITATRTLKEWVAEDWLSMPVKRGQGALYGPGSRLLHHAQIPSEITEPAAIEADTDAIKVRILAESPVESVGGTQLTARQWQSWMKSNQRQRMAEDLVDRVRGATKLALKDWENGEAPFWELVAALGRLFPGVKPLYNDDNVKSGPQLHQYMAKGP
jgi:hypothetical protein